LPIQHPDFAGQLAKQHVIFRIPRRTFGDGLIEAITTRPLPRTILRAIRPDESDKPESKATSTPMATMARNAMWLEGAEQVAADFLG